VATRHPSDPKAGCQLPLVRPKRTAVAWRRLSRMSTRSPSGARPAWKKRLGRVALVLGGVFVVVATPICLLMVVFAARLAALLKRSPRVMRAIDWLFAGIFSAFAARLLFARAH